MSKCGPPEPGRHLEGKRVDVAKKGPGLCLEVGSYLQGPGYVILFKILLDNGFIYYAESHEVSAPADHRPA